MKRSVKALIVTFMSGIIGIFLGASMNLEGYLGVILSIATVGYFIISAIEDIQKNERKMN